MRKKWCPGGTAVPRLFVNDAVVSAKRPHIMLRKQSPMMQAIMFGQTIHRTHEVTPSDPLPQRGPTLSRRESTEVWPAPKLVLQAIPQQTQALNAVRLLHAAAGCSEASSSQAPDTRAYSSQGQMLPHGFGQLPLLHFKEPEVATTTCRRPLCADLYVFPNRTVSTPALAKAPCPVQSIGGALGCNSTLFQAESGLCSTAHNSARASLAVAAQDRACTQHGVRACAGSSNGSVNNARNQGCPGARPAADAKPDCQGNLGGGTHEALLRQNIPWLLRKGMGHLAVEASLSLSLRTINKLQPQQR